jgi:patatin-like phospholipase/acyl hydrolase
MVCATRKAISKPDNLRSFKTTAATEENYDCTIWEATSATTAAPFYFKSVKFTGNGEEWCDGGLKRNNPILEVMAELKREKSFKDRKVGCVLSLGTGAPKIGKVSSNIIGFLKGAVEMMTNSEDIADDFAASDEGKTLASTNRYFRFNVPQGMEDLKLDESDAKAMEKMNALTTNYLRQVGSGNEVERCAKSLLSPDENC